MSRLVYLLLALPLSAFAQAVWVGPNTHQLEWKPNPSTEMVEGYQVYVESIGPSTVLASQRVGSVTQVPLAVFDLPQGRYEAWVTAYNPLGESGPSARVPFVLVRSAPGDPGGVSAPGGLKIVPLIEE